MSQIEENYSPRYQLKEILGKMKSDYDKIIDQKDTEFKSILSSLTQEKFKLESQIEELTKENAILKELNKFNLTLDSSKNANNFYDTIVERKKVNEKKANLFENNFKTKTENLKKEFEEVKKKFNLISFSDTNEFEKIMEEAENQISEYQKEILKLTEKDFENEKLIMKLNFNNESLKEENSFIKRKVIQEKEKISNAIAQIKEENYLNIQKAKNEFMSENCFKEIMLKFNKENKIPIETEKIIKENMELYSKINELNNKLEISKNLVNQVVQEIEAEQQANLELKKEIMELKKKSDS